MLSEKIERYISVRQTLGCKLKDTKRELLAFGKFATQRGDGHITTETSLQWADKASSAYTRSIRLVRITRLAKFLNAEENIHEVVNPLAFKHVYVRPLPYIYSEEEIRSILAATDKLQKNYPLRKQVYKMMIGLIASTGLRASEALNLKIDDISKDGTLRIQKTKFGKSRLVPIHPSVWTVFQQYLVERSKIGSATVDRNVFVSRNDRRIAPSILNRTFRVILLIAGVTGRSNREPRIHDLRHTFATRALQLCGTDRESVAKQFVALATYLGHSDIKHTYWYLSATPDLMESIVDAVEKYLAGRGVQ